MPDEQTADTWVIHGQAYDLSSFLDRHPGGRLALACGRGRDCTALFESYHSLTDGKPAKLLEQYKVDRPGAVSKLKQFKWAKDDAFYAEVRRDVKEYFKKNRMSHKASWTRLAIFWLGLLSCAFPIYYFAQGHYWALILMPLWLWVYSVNYFHDASHFSLSKRPWFNTLVMYLFPYFESPSTWLHQHIIGHHCYTNIDALDPDVMDRLKERKRIWRYSVLYWPLFTAMGCFVFDAAFLVTFKYKRKVPMAVWFKSIASYLLHIAGRALTFYLMHYLPYNWFGGFKGVLFAAVPVLIFGACFAAMTQLNHMTPQTYGNRDSQTKSWAAHELQTTLNIAPESTFWYIFSGALSLQVEHHLFPSVCSEHYPALRPIVKAEVPSYWVAFKQHMALLQTCTEGGFWA